MYSTLIKLLCSSVFAIGILAISSSISLAQVEQTQRYEIPLSTWDADFSIISASTQGIYLNRISRKGQDQFLQLIKLDTAFQENWSGLLPIPQNYNVTYKKVEQDRLYVLMRYINYTNNNLYLYIINNENGEFKRHVIRSYIPFLQTTFEVSNKAVLIGGYYNNVPVVLHYNIELQQSKVLPGIFNETGELTQIKVNANNSFDVLVAAKNKNKQRTLWIKSYSPEGDLVANRALEPNSNNHLLFGREIRSGNNEQLIAGVFGNRMKEFSKGLFVTKIKDDEEVTRYYNFADMENFFKFMRAKREQRVKSRIERKKIKGKKIRMAYRFLLHELVPYNDNFILLGEAFYPKYHNSTTGFSRFGFQAPYSSGERVFAGYQYTHAVVMCFDKTGKMLWDNSFEINDARSFELEQFVKLEVHQDKIAMMYLFDNQIRTKVIKDNQVVEGKMSDPIKTLREYDRVKGNDVENGKLDYWYNDKLYACGVQEIVSQGLGKRKVFFINKVTFKN